MRQPECGEVSQSYLKLPLNNPTQRGGLVCFVEHLIDKELVTYDK